MPDLPLPITLPPGWRLDARDSVGSTNDEARALAVAGAPHGTIVSARRQDAARGRRGRGGAAPDKTVDWIVAGIGVNVAHHPQLADYNATSLHAAGARDATVDALLERLAAALDRRLVEWRAGGFDATRAAWLERAVGLGARIKVRLETETLEGVFEQIDPSGALILRTDTGRHSITAGDVFFGRG
jgi:biotin-(acetyl-CoA carboxylase) ligase